MERAVKGAEKAMLGFETLTFAPIDRNLIDTAMLTAGERAWVDDYHRQVVGGVGARLDGEAKPGSKPNAAPSMRES